MFYKRADTVIFLTTKISMISCGILLSYLTLACQSQGQSDLGSSQKRRKQNNSLELSLVDGHEGNSPKKGTAPFKDSLSRKKSKQMERANNTRNAKMRDFQEYCRTLVTRFSPYYQDLISSLPLHIQQLHSARLDPLKAIDATGCTEPDGIRSTLSDLRKISTSYKPCVGLILPLTSSSHKTTEDMVRGLRAAFVELRGDKALFEETFRIRDSGGSASKAKQHFAELTVADQCGIIAGGIESQEAQQLVTLAQGIQQPLLLLSARTPIPPEAPSIFTVFPTQSRLAHALVKGCKARGIHKVAIMKPSHGRSDRLIDEFKQQFAADGGTIVDEILYTPSQFDAMQAAARKLFRTDIIGREAEYRDAIKKAQKKAELANEKFNPKMVLLPPHVSFDALFIPDDFRSVRHLIKLIKYHMVSRLTLIGNHEWRSQGLLNPPEPFLDGSFFVDFVPRYDQIPRSIPVVFDGSPYFAQPQSASQIDFQLIGYSLGRIILEFLNQAPSNRMALSSSLANLKILDPTNAVQQAVFDSQRKALWRTYGYEIRQGMIQSLEVMTTEIKRQDPHSRQVFSQR